MDMQQNNRTHREVYAASGEAIIKPLPISAMAAVVMAFRY
jgi:hypothetical protein